MAYTASAPVNARFSAFSSVTFAVKASAPRLVNAASFLLSRPTTRTFFRLPSSEFATTEPVFPVAPRITYIVSSLVLLGVGLDAAADGGVIGQLMGIFTLVFFAK